MRSICSPALLVLALAPALASGAEAARTYGAPLKGMAPMALGDVLAHAEDGKPVCLEGTVSAVCTAKGCWLELKQGEQAVHVSFAGYSFFVPKDSKGKAVKLEGKLEVKKNAPRADDVDHLKGEGAGDSAAAKVSVVATGVELR